MLNAADQAVHTKVSRLSVDPLVKASSLSVAGIGQRMMIVLPEACAPMPPAQAGAGFFSAWPSRILNQAVRISMQWCSLAHATLQSLRDTPLPCVDRF